MKKYLQLMLVAILTLAFLFGTYSCSADKQKTEESAASGKTRQEVEYTCAMHPQIRSNEPGTCPICGMELIPVEDDGGQVLTKWLIL